MQRTATFLMKRLNSLANIAQSAAVPADAGSQLSPDIQIKDEIQQSQNRTRAVFARLKALTEEAARVESNEKELKEALIVMAKDKNCSSSNNCPCPIERKRNFVFERSATALVQSNEK